MEEYIKECVKAIDKLYNDYDAFYFSNKYSSLENLVDNTHQKEFEILINKFKNDEMSLKAIIWILYSYDCHYKDEIDYEKSVFAYLKNELQELLQ